MSKGKGIRPLALLGGLLLDLALMATGVLLYRAFVPQPERLAALWPALAAGPVGAETLVLAVAGLPFAAGLFSLLKTLWRLLSALRRSGR